MVAASPLLCDRVGHSWWPSASHMRFVGIVDVVEISWVGDIVERVEQGGLSRPGHPDEDNFHVRLLPKRAGEEERAHDNQRWHCTVSTSIRKPAATKVSERLNGGL